MRLFFRFGILLAICLVTSLFVPDAFSLQSQKPSQQEKTDDDIAALRKKHRALLSKYGEGHPQVVELQLMISSMEDTKKRWSKDASPPVEEEKDFLAITDAELRSLVGKLMERVTRLEKDVEELKHPKARVELLKPNRRDQD